MNHADHHRRQRSFDRAQRAYDNMSPLEDPRDGMDEPEAEAESAQEKAEATADRVKDERKERELDELREAIKGPSVDTHWACGCTKRNPDGTLRAIKLNANSVKRCRKCGAIRPPANSPNEKGQP